MLSGTKGKLSYLKRAQRKQAILQKQRLQDIESNKEQVIKVICEALGWDKLEPFAQQMVDNALASNIVDIKKLTEDLAAWKNNVVSEGN